MEIGASKFFKVAILYGALIGFSLYMIVLSYQGLQHELLRRSPNVQTITAIVTGNKYICNRSDCYYVAYGSYTVNGTRQTNVAVAESRYALSGEVGIRVNPTQPRFAMDLYQKSYMPQIVLPLVFLLVAAAYGFLISRLHRRYIKRMPSAKDK